MTVGATEGVTEEGYQKSKGGVHMNNAIVTDFERYTISCACFVNKLLLKIVRKTRLTSFDANILFLRQLLCGVLRVRLGGVVMGGINLSLGFNSLRKLHF